MPRPRRLPIAFALLVLASTAYSVRRARLGGDIAHFLPDDGDPVMAEASRALAASELSRTLLVVLEGDSPARLRDAGAALARALRARPDVAWVYRGVQPEVTAAFQQRYRPRRLAFFDDGPPEALRARLTEGALRDAARALRRRLASPAGALHARLAPEDPLGAFDALLTRVREAQGTQLRSVEGQLQTADGRGAVILVTTRASAFDAARQRPLLAAIDAAVRDLRANAPGLRVHRAGAHPITVAAEAQTRRDAERISLAGSLGVAALFLALHRSPRYLALAALPVAAGTALAFAACLAAFGAVHGLTLAFGASLIGVTFDYPVYLINHHTLRPDDAGPSGTLRRVWPGLRLGALTTVGGLVGMGLTSFPGLRELALFAAVGVLGALVATKLLVAPLLPARPSPVPLQRWLATWLAARVAPFAAGARRWIPAAMVLVLALGATRLRWDDDVRSLTRVDASLAAEARRATAAVGRGDDPAVVLAVGDDDEEALRRNEIVSQTVTALRGAGAVTALRSAHAALWSRALQARNEALLREDATLPARLDAAFAAEGFRPGAFAPFAAALRAPPPPPLTYDALANSPLADLVRAHRIAVGRRVAYLTFLEGPAELTRDRAALRGAPGVVVFDQRSLRGAYARYRERTLGARRRARAGLRDAARALPTRGDGARDHGARGAGVRGHPRGDGPRGGAGEPAAPRRRDPGAERRRRLRDLSRGDPPAPRGRARDRAERGRRVVHRGAVVRAPRALRRRPAPRHRAHHRPRRHAEPAPRPLAHPTEDRP
ncbi:MAG: hypothetical protein U0325_03260 [Polyangiales bacterium]